MGKWKQIVREKKRKYHKIRLEMDKDDENMHKSFERSNKEDVKKISELTHCRPILRA